MSKWMWVLIAAAGCATTAPPTASAPVVTQVVQEVQICRDGGALSVGEKVQIARRVCRPLNAKSVVQSCTPAQVDGGEVVRVVDERCAVVKVSAESQIRPGDQLELVTR